MGKNTAVQVLLEQHAESVEVLVSMVFAGADAAMETLEDSSGARQLGRQEEQIAPSKMPLSKLFSLSRKNLQRLLIGSLLLGLARRVASIVGRRSLGKSKRRRLLRCPAPKAWGLAALPP